MFLNLCSDLRRREDGIAMCVWKRRSGAAVFYCSRSLSLIKSYAVSFKHIGKQASPPSASLEPLRTSMSSLSVLIRYCKAYMDFPPACKNIFASSLLPPQEYRIRRSSRLDVGARSSFKHVIIHPNTSQYPCMTRRLPVIVRLRAIGM